jgi:hypothetical protein
MELKNCKPFFLNEFSSILILKNLKKKSGQNFLVWFVCEVLKNHDLLGERFWFKKGENFGLKIRTCHITQKTVL